MGSCAFLLAAILLPLSGCGYGFSGGGGLTRVAQGHRVRPGPVENQSSDPDAGIEVARMISHKAAQRGAFRGDGPEALLGARVLSVTATPTGVGTSRDVHYWSVDARLRFTLHEPGPSGSKLLAQSEVSGGEGFLPGFDPESTEVSRRLALQRLLERLVDEGLDRLSAP